MPLALPEQPKNIQLELLRVIASIGVVLIHVAALVLDRPIAEYGGVTWAWTSTVIMDASVRWVVPVFFMISGYLFLEVKRDRSIITIATVCTFWKRRLIRLLPPLVFWISFYAVAYHFFKHDPLSLQFVLRRIIFDQTYEHLYFVFVLIFLACVTPFYAYASREMTERQRLWLSIFTAMCCFIFPKTRFLLLFWIPYAGFFFLGQSVTLLRRVVKLPWWWYMVVIGTMQIITVFLVIHGNTVRTTEDPFFAFSYFSPQVLVMSCAVFALAMQPQVGKWIARFSNRAHLFIRRLSTASFGIYLLHPVFVAMVGISCPSMYKYGMFFVLFATVAVHTLSYSCVSVSQLFFAMVRRKVCYNTIAD